MKATIKALLKTLSPLHIAHPDNARMDDSGKVVYKDEAFAMTSIQKMTLPFDIQASISEQEDQKHRLPRYPVIAANNIAGRLRRHAAQHIIKAITAKGEKLSMHAYGVLMCGASTGIPDGALMNYGEYIRSRKHPYFGLFGGGPKMFTRRLRVHNALPITPKTNELKGNLAHPISKDKLIPDARVREIVQRWGFRRVDDLSDLAGIEVAEQSIEAFEAAFVERQAQIIEEAAKQKEKDRISTKTYSAIEFVVPNVIFDVTMELDVATDAQIGLYLETLDSFAATERLGGHTRNGFGVFTFENIKFCTEDGQEIDIFNNGRLNRHDANVSNWLQAWTNEAQSIDVSSLENLIAMSEQSKKKAAEKAEKRAKKKVAQAAEA